MSDTTAGTEPYAAYLNIPLDAIRLSDSEPQKQRRARFDDVQLDELAASIRDHGVLQPIIVRPHVDEGDRSHLYELVAGERRYLAATLAGLSEIPAVVRSLTDEQVLEVQLIENLQRADLHPMEEAEGYQQLMRVHGHPIEELHARVGKSRSYVYGRLKLLSLSPKAREAFYAGKIGASVALLIARIPHEKLQDEALGDILGRAGLGEMTPGEAKTYIHEHYMLRLKGAPFRTDDETLPGGPCSTCPKRTGNQPELFGDVRGADTCTDPTCFQGKVREQGNRELAQAKRDGFKVVSRSEAKRVWRYDDTRIYGYHRPNEKVYASASATTVRVSAIVPEDEKPLVIQNPRTGEVARVYPAAVVDAALRRYNREHGQRERPDDGTRERARRAKIEKAFRRKLYEELRLGLLDRGLVLSELATVLLERLEHDALKELCRIRSFDPPARTSVYGPSGPDYYAIGDTLGELSLEELELFILDCIFAREMLVYTWNDKKPELLLAAAKEFGVDTAAIRRAVTPKKKAKKKAAKRGGRARRSTEEVSA